MKRIWMLPITCLVGFILCSFAAVGVAANPTGLISGTVVPNGVVLSMAQDKVHHALYVAGRFAGFAAKTGGGATLDHHGKLEQQHAVFDGNVFASVADGHGGFYVGGNFSNVDATGIKRIAHINSDGSVDNHFKPLINDTVRHVAILNTRLYVATYRKVYEIDLLSGDINSAFVLNTDADIFAMHVTNFGVYIGGLFKHVNGLNIPFFAKASRNTGVVDTGYYRSPEIVYQILSRPNDELFLVLRNTDNMILKLHEVSGSVNNNFNIGKVRALSLDAAIDGNWLYASHANVPYLRRYNIISGRLDRTFSVRLNTYPQVIHFDDHYMYMSGAFTLINGSSAVKRNARLDKVTWQLDTSYHPLFRGRLTTIATGGDKIFTGGYFFGVGNEGVPYLAKIDLTTGLPDPTFAPKINGNVNAVAINGEHVFIGGEFSAIDNQPAQRIAMLSTAGVVDETFKPHADGTVYVLKTHRGYLYMGGRFRHVGGRVAYCLTRFKLDTLAQERTFDFGQNNVVWDVAFAGKYMFVGGQFTDRLRKYSLDTGIKINSFNPAISGTVKNVLFDVDHVYAAGYFPGVVVRLNPRTGAPRPKFKPALTGRGFSLAKHGDSIYVGLDNALVRLDKVTGVQDVSFNPQTDGIVYSLLVDDNRLFAAGYFTHIFNQFMPYLSDTAL
ncbi:MAG: hypothetical protein P1U40_11985 [Coxiellaceae bacterium]|nr:hypothetical protein [Coxiellaceae bacterium]